MKKFDLSQLSPIQYHITQENGTEPPFKNPYHDFFEEGLYVDVVSKEVLFSSKDKFDSHCGWPSFSKPIAPLKEKKDLAFGMVRIEVRSELADSHLGHVFNDGPKDQGGLRYCINSAALEFIPKSKMRDRGFEAYLHVFDDTDVVE